MTEAHQFFRRNSEKLASLEEKDFAVFEQLLDMVTKRMTTPEVQIDMMPLADLGQPQKIALEIHRQLRLQFGSVPRRIPLAEIAKAVGIVGIKLVEGTSYEGTLVIANGKSAIGNRLGLRSGRHNLPSGMKLVIF